MAGSAESSTAVAPAAKRMRFGNRSVKQVELGAETDFGIDRSVNEHEGPSRVQIVLSPDPRRFKL